jgi:hypothetical protein
MKTRQVYDNIAKKMVAHNDLSATVVELEQRITDLEQKNTVLEDNVVLNTQLILDYESRIKKLEEKVK